MSRWSYWCFPSITNLEIVCIHVVPQVSSPPPPPPAADFLMNLFEYFLPGIFEIIDLVCDVCSTNGFPFLLYSFCDSLCFSILDFF